MGFVPVKYKQPNLQVSVCLVMIASYIWGSLSCYLDGLQWLSYISEKIESEVRFSRGSPAMPK